MKKYNNYLNENITDGQLKLIFENCKYFFENWKGDIIYRASNDEPFDKQIVRLKTIKDRKPSNTPINIHNKLNDLFLKLFGWKVRNGVFTTQDENYWEKIGIYAENYIFLPIGKYEYVYSNKIYDLYENVDKIFYQGVFDFTYKNIEYNPRDYTKRGSNLFLPKKSIFTELDDDVLKYFLTNVLEYKNKGIPVKTSEISFKCDEYYLMNISFINKIKKLMNKNG